MKNVNPEQQQVAEFLIMSTLIEAHKQGKRGLRESEVFEILGLDHDGDEDPFYELSPKVIADIEMFEAMFESNVSTKQ